MNRKLTGRQERAAVLVAEDYLTDEEIAEQIQLERRTLARWKLQPEFRARVDEITQEMATFARRRGIARRERRLAVLDRTHRRLLKVIEERAADPTMADVPGGTTGLVVRQFKVSGETVVTEYAVDTGTIRELRAVAEQAAKELGQTVERHEHRVIRSAKDLSDEELAAIASETD